MTSPEATSAVPFLDRDLSWLEFNRRVLHEAVDERTPLLERVKFLAIFSSNLDEWFMKRAEPLRDARPEDGAATAPIVRARQAILPLLADQARTFTEIIRPELARNGVRLLSWADLDQGQRQAAVSYYRQNVFPVLTPLKVDPAHPFPFISNLSTSLGIFQRAPGATESRFARVKVPAGLPQWVSLPEAAAGPPGHCFVKLLDVIANTLEELFPGMHTLEVMPFRLTRNADVELDDDVQIGRAS